MRKKNIAPIEVSGFRYTSGFAYVIIPKGLDRDTYIQDCYRTKSVSIMTRNGSYENRVPVSDSVLDKIKFPKDDSGLGSIVFWNKVMPNNKIVIIDFFSHKDNWTNIEENSFNVSRQSGNAAVDIIGNGNKGNLIINVEGDGLLNIVVSNTNNNGQVNLTVQGKINIVADDTIQITSEDIRHNKANEQMVRGNYLKDEIIDEIINILLNAKTATSIGLQPLDPQTITNLQQVLNKTKNILSDKSRLE